MANQEEIGFQVGDVIGDKKIGMMIGDTLKEHISLAGDAVVAIFKNDVIYDKILSLLNNSTKLALLLQAINPVNFPFQTTKSLFDDHNMMLIDLAIARYQRKNSEKTFDGYYTHMLGFADYICNGVNL
jgi:hypothetical protein